MQPKQWFLSLSPRAQQGVALFLGAVAAYLLWALVSSPAANAAAASNGSAVQHVTAENLDAFLAQPDVVLMVHAHWCPHCRTMHPLFQKAAAKAPKGGPRFGLIDGHSEKGVAQKLQVEAYPTIYRIRHGERTKYGGGFDHEQLLEFAA